MAWSDIYRYTQNYYEPIRKYFVNITHEEFQILLVPKNFCFFGWVVANSHTFFLSKSIHALEVTLIV